MLGNLVRILLWSALAFAQDWPAYHGSPANTKHSPLDQINTSNVGRLRLAWKFDTGDARKDSEMQCNPLVTRGIVYLSSPQLRIFALDAATGAQLWRFDPHNGTPPPGKFRHRGFNYWESPDAADRRLYFAAGPYLYSLDARTGRPIPSFGTNGRIDLRHNLGRDASTLTVGLSSPGVVFNDLLIVGSIVSEALPAAPGHIRAFDTRTGALRWIFHTIPQPGEFGYNTWPRDAYLSTGAANAWGGLTLDHDRALVFVPTGSAAYDFYGANRHGDNLFANCLIALDARTGRRRWHFQFVRHDVWDRDLPTAPTLVTITRNGRTIDAVAQITKSGFVWLFDRETGKSLFPFREIKVPASDLPGERLATRQRLPLAPPPFARQQFTEAQATRRTPQAHADVVARLRQLRNGPQFTPPSRQGTIIFPGLDGGGEWGGASFDPSTGLLYVNSNEMTWILRMVERTLPATQSARSLYLRNCAACHKDDLAGAPPEFPSLTGLAARRTPAQVRNILLNGAGRMPAYSHLKPDALDALVTLLISGQDTQLAAAAAPSPFDLRFRLDGYVRFTDPDLYPAIEPPWGTLNALDLNTGQYRWQIPFGEIPALAAQGLPNTGSENYGGAIVTSGGLLFIAATNSDHKFRAFDKLTGRLLWHHTMDAAGNATPATYLAAGRQFVLIGAGGGKWGNASGGAYYAFSLPE